MKSDTYSIVIFSILLPLFLLLLSYTIILYYTSQFTSLTAEQEHTFDYLQGKGALSVGYTVQERFHLENVKQVMDAAHYFFYGLLLVLAVIIAAHRDNHPQLRKLLRYGGITTIAVVSLILIFILTSFTIPFTVFHWLFFPQGNWQFPADSLLIQTFPQEFFVKMGIWIFMVAMLWGAVIVAVSTLLVKE